MSIKVSRPATDEDRAHAKRMADLRWSKQLQRSHYQAKIAFWTVFALCCVAAFLFGYIMVR